MPNEAHHTPMSFVRRVFAAGIISSSERTALPPLCDGHAQIPLCSYLWLQPPNILTDILFRCCGAQSTRTFLRWDLSYLAYCGECCLRFVGHACHALPCVPREPTCRRRQHHRSPPQPPWPPPPSLRRQLRPPWCQSLRTSPMLLPGLPTMRRPPPAGAPTKGPAMPPTTLQPQGCLFSGFFFHRRGTNENKNGVIRPDPKHNTKQTHNRLLRLAPNG